MMCGVRLVQRLFILKQLDALGSGGGSHRQRQLFFCLFVCFAASLLPPTPTSVPWAATPVTLPLSYTTVISPVSCSLHIL